MMRLASNSVLFVTLTLFVLFGTLDFKFCDGQRLNGLKMKNIYRKSCRKVDNVAANPSLGAKLLRVHYHDCFVRVLIDEIKTQLEKECPETVSCADILALSARDVVSLHVHIPLESHDVHGVISRRLFNFTGNGDTDPSINPTFANILKGQCAGANGNVLEMDPGSSTSFDGHYYKNLNENKGVFQSDAALLTNRFSKFLAKRFERDNTFFANFATSMINIEDFFLIHLSCLPKSRNRKIIYVSWIFVVCANLFFSPMFQVKNCISTFFRPL
ncbi:hypothetical protein MKX03_010831 [Papaver bracteatum]|nr:hypothetical protein MKX03_010831 [Papaver bracteatum]